MDAYVPQRADVGRLSAAAARMALVAMTAISGVACAADALCSNEQTAAIAAQLHYDSSQFHQRACKALPHMPGYAALALAFRDDPSEANGAPMDGDYDLDLLIVRQDGSILRRLRLKQVIESDAMRFSSLSIDTGRYTIAPGARAVGVRVSHANSSRSNGYSSQALMLFVDDGATLRQVLTRLEVSKESGEWDLQCVGAFQSMKRAIDVGPDTSHGLRDLIVTTTVVDSVNAGVAGDCKTTEHKPVVSRQTVRYDGHVYAVPANLK